MLALEGIEIRQDDWRMTADVGFAAGEATALIGPSGAGKSTLLNLIAGFLAPARGRVLWEGRDITGLAPSARPVTLLFQEHNLFAHLSAAKNVGLGLRPDLRLDRAGWARVSEALAAVGLDGMEARRPDQLSGGQRQRVALARALIRARPILLLDEPFAALGPALRAEMLDLVARIRAEQGATLLMVTHDPADARRICDRVALVAEGRVAPPAPTAALLDDPPPGFRDYLG
ncbi:MAG: thiamine ABC transporter ATP-binding protein [Rhodovulum sulfidophilum]|uniref:Thiamine ABC transporter ATP-binding protein n=1 Tax=Rhodovulum sulfidophilum TaxID=35806 RepID=A0A2W5QEL8_RHOSU|nr:MAG: thiamine ABC transporter ATP-binding protein [Rhodovulum sulfidophilum]